jgi:transcriptional regulator with XRE-family HTH domain
MSRERTTEFGLKIARCRRRRGLTQFQAARIMGVQRTSLSRWENGREMPCGENMTKLRDHLDVPIGSTDEVEIPQVITYQLLLPFDQPIGIEVKVAPGRQNSVQFEVQLKNIAS